MQTKMRKKESWHINQATI